MPTIHKCENHKSCKGWAEPGETRCQYCREADQKAAQEQATKWQYAGWTRVDERQQLQGKKGRR